MTQTGPGWMPNVEHIPTEASGGYGMAPDTMDSVAVMSHIMQGYQRTMIRWAEERPYATEKSAHFTIGRDGRIVQHVGIYNPSWTAGNVKNPTWRLYRPGVNPNKYLVQIEHEGFSVEPGYGYDYLYSESMPWPDEMVMASVEVHKWVMLELGLEPDHDTVIGHFMTNSVTRLDDPGKDWPRERIIDRIGGVSILPPALTRIRATIAVWRGEEVPVPVRRVGDKDYYEFYVRRQ